MNWFPLLNFSHYDIKYGGLSRESIIIPEKLVKYCKKLGYNAVGLADHSGMAYAIKFYKSCKEEDIKPVFGTSVPTELGYLRLFAKNYDGFIALYKCLNKSCVNKQIKVGEVKKLIGDNCIVLIGEYGSDFTERSKQNPKEVLNNYYKLFGENLFVANDISDLENRQRILEIAKTSNIDLPILDVNSTYYLKREDAEDQLVPLALNNDLLLGDLPTTENPNVRRFLDNKDLRVLLPEESGGLSSGDFLDRVSDFDITKSVPEIYPFPCHDGLSSKDYLLKLAREGWKKRYKQDWDKSLYSSRIKEELEIINKYGLADYFLIVQDYMNFARDRWYCSSGRGSVGGSLLAYLLNITEIDPILYNLLFVRFINPARFSPTSFQPPDVDSDFPPSARPEIIKYITDKYGRNHVCQVATFSRMMGRSALSDVLKAHGYDYKEAKIITKYVPNEAAVADELQEMKKETGTSSLVIWALENKPELKQWCTYKNGNFDGPLAKEFQQAIRLEGVKRSIGQHASAILLSKKPLDECVPLVYNKDGDLISAEEYPDTEAKAILKLDILGLDLLDKMEFATNLIKKKKIKRPT